MLLRTKMDYRAPFLHREVVENGDVRKFFIPGKLVENNDEIYLGIKLVANRLLFGYCYAQVLGDYFYSMPYRSGVLIKGFIPTKKICPNISFPGDIDLLIIPYEENELVLSNTLVVELKVIRAKFLKQGKSPNQLGVSQAQALLKAGFPYVATGHLIISDKSPREYWRKIGITRIKNAETGACEDITYVHADMLPADLMYRAVGRMKQRCDNSHIGFFASYISESGNWMPCGFSARRNPEFSQETLDNIYKYYCENSSRFLLTKRYPYDC